MTWLYIILIFICRPLSWAVVEEGERPPTPYKLSLFGDKCEHPVRTEVWPVSARGQMLNAMASALPQWRCGI